MQILYNIDIMPVGKHKGMMVQDIVDKYPEYVRKFDDNNIAFCDDIMLEVGRLTSNTKIQKPKKYHYSNGSYNNILNTKTN